MAHGAASNLRAVPCHGADDWGPGRAHPQALAHAEQYRSGQHCSIGVSGWVWWVRGQGRMWVWVQVGVSVRRAVNTCASTRLQNTVDSQRCCCRHTLPSGGREGSARSALT